MCSEPRHNNNNRKGTAAVACRRRRHKVHVPWVCLCLGVCVCACVCSWVCVGHLTLAQLCDSFLANGAITHARLSCESSRLYAIKIFTRHRQRGQLCESSLLATHTHTCIHALTGGCKFRQNAVAYFFAHYCTRFPSLLHLRADGKRGKCSALTHFICILHTIQYIYIYILYT